MKKTTILSVCAIIALALVLGTGPALAKTPDGKTPAEETVCDGEIGAGFGLCNAFCEAMDCDLLPIFGGDGDPLPNASEKACLRTLDNYIKLTGNTAFPCQCPEPGSGTGTGTFGCACNSDADCNGGMSLVCSGTPSNPGVCVEDDGGPGA